MTERNPDLPFVSLHRLCIKSTKAAMIIRIGRGSHHSRTGLLRLCESLNLKYMQIRRRLFLVLKNQCLYKVREMPTFPDSAFRTLTTSDCDTHRGNVRRLDAHARTENGPPHMCLGRIARYLYCISRVFYFIMFST